MIRGHRIILAASTAFAFIAPGGPATAQDTVKIGVVAEFSGPFARLRHADPARHEDLPQS